MTSCESSWGSSGPPERSSGLGRIWQGVAMPKARRFDGLAEVPSDWGKSVVTIGVFDGVHRGHRMIVGRAEALATQPGASVVAVTFDPHPSAVVRPDSQPLMLSNIDHRVALLGAAGADAVLVLPFTA